MQGLPERALRGLLRMFPEDFRAEYGDEIGSAFRDEYGRTGGWRFWMHMFRDFSRAAMEEHWSMTLSDLRVSARRHLTQPGFAVVAVASLALGIGATTAIFSVLYASILQPLPFREPNELMLLRGHREGAQPQFTVYSADLVEWRERSQSFSQLEMVTFPDRVTISGAGLYPERTSKQNVTPGFFPMLGIQPLRGRLFTEEEARSSAPVVLIGESYWQRRYGGDPEVIGRSLAWGGTSRTIIGIIPAAYRAGFLTTNADLWVPIDLTPSSNWVQRQIPWIAAIGRLKQEISIVAAQTELRGLAQQLATAYPQSNRNWTVTVEPLGKALSGPLEPVLLPLTAAAAFVLLIGCANVANLLLARAASRRRELAMRAALGAGRRRLLRELLADGVVLALPGVALGIGLAWGGMQLFLSLWDGFSYGAEVRLNLPVLAFAVSAGLVTSIAASLIPAWQASRTNVTEVLKEGGRGTAGHGRTWLRNGLVVSEIALAVTLLTGAGLMLRTVGQLRSAALGFQPEGIATMRIDLSGERYGPSAPKRRIDMRYVEPNTQRLLEESLAELRGNGWVKEAIWASWLPMGQGGGADRIRISGRNSEELHSTLLNCVTDGYFSMLRTPIIRGRAIGVQDHGGAQWVVVINEALAAAYFPGEDPIGNYITIATTEEEQPRLIVGIAANQRKFGPRVPPQPEIFTSFAQQPRLIPGNQQGVRLRPTLAVRTGLEISEVEKSVRQILKRIDPEVAVHDVQVYRDQLRDRHGLEATYAKMLGLFGGLALILAAVGIFGLMHYAVADRTPEIGIRMALGAERKHVLRMVLGQGVGLAVVGLVLGALGAAGATKGIERFLFGVERADPWIVVGVGAVMLAVAVLACYVPARRALAVDPMVALRAE